MANTDLTSSSHLALRYLLRPIARFFLRRSKTFQVFTELAKIAFVEVAVDEIKKTSDKVNASRVSVITGLQRKDVARIMKGEAKPLKNSATLLARIIGLWETSSDFQTKDKKPRVLSYGTEDSDFSELVREVGRDLKPGTVLFELERVGAVEKTARGIKLQAIERSLVDDEGKVEILSREIDTIIQMAEDNIKHPDNRPHLHLRTHYDNIFEDELPQIREWLMKEGAKFHKKARQFISQFDKDVNFDKAREAGKNVVLTSYSFMPEQRAPNSEDS